MPKGLSMFNRAVRREETMRLMPFCRAVVLAGLVLSIAPAMAEGTTVSPSLAEHMARTKPLRDTYEKAIHDQILARWTIPPSVRSGQKCKVTITQLPGGNVVSAKPTSECDFDEIGQQSIIAAVLNAQPLPYRGYEQVFMRSLEITFAAPPTG